jgi:hypothetical protein
MLYFPKDLEHAATIPKPHGCSSPLPQKIVDESVGKLVGIGDSQKTGRLIGFQRAGVR